MSGALPDQLIDRLRAHGAPEAALGLRLALGAALAQADLRPPGLPPGAILIVRRLTDPLPGALGSGGGGRWERAARHVLAELGRRACRPALGPVPDTAEAVIFADEAELLACLAADLAGGRAAVCWWWRAPLRGLSPSPAGLAPLLSARAMALPAAFALLVDRGEAARVLAAMGSAAAHTIFTALCRIYEAPALPVAVAPQLLGAVAAAPAGSTRSADLPPEPWRPFLPAPALLLAGTKQAPEARCLLGVALALHHNPSAARSPTFAARLAAWWLAGAPDESLPEGHRNARLATSSPAGLGASPPYAVWPKQAAQVPPSELALAGLDQISHEAFVPLRAEERRSGRQAQHLTTDAAKPLECAPEETLPPNPVTISHEGLATAVGGLLYLVNLMRGLALPGVFEDTWRLASGAGGWGVLEAIGRGLLAPHHDVLAADPLWAALAALAGRDPQDPLGAAVTTGPTTLPAAWEPYADAGAVPLPTHSRLLAPLAPTMTAWLRLALPAIRRCLLVTLSGGPPEHAQFGADDDPVGDLLVRPAAVYITNTHVDAVMSLESISLPARLAGLDHDPGWVPDLGRVVRFHFD